MARKNSAFWLLVLAGVMMLALIVGMDMLVDVDPSVPAIMSVRKQAGRLFPGSSLAHRFDPPITVELKEGEKRARGLILSIVFPKELQADAFGSEAKIKEALTFMRSCVSADDTLDRVITWYRVDVFPDDVLVEERKEPLISRRVEHTQRSSKFNPNPEARPVRVPGNDKGK